MNNQVFPRQQSGYPKASDLLHERYWRAKNICQPAARYFTSLRMTLALRLRSGTGTGQMARGVGKRSTCLSLKKVDSQNTRVTMFQYQTKTRDLYFEKAIDLYLREGLSYRQIAKILPVSKTTIMR